MSTPPRVVVSGLFLNHPHTGTGRIATRMCAALSRTEALETVVVTDRAAADLAPVAPGARLVRAPRSPLALGVQGHKLYWEQAALPLAALRLGADVLYSPHFSAPLFAPCPTVISIHDLIPLTEPHYAPSRATRAYFRLVGAAARQAAAVVTLSRHARGEIERLLGIPGERVHVVYPGIEARFNVTTDEAALARARARLGLPERYLLYLGGADERKNIGLLIEAARALGADDAVPPLVIAARLPKSGDGRLFPDWRAMARDLPPGRVRFVEFIEEEDLAAVYRSALAFCFPSRAEGFGLDPLEAMACGTPVLCSSAGSLPEAVGDAALLLEPADAGAWVAAMRRVSTDVALRAQLRGRGVERAAGFRWEHTASQVIDIILWVSACAS